MESNHSFFRFALKRVKLHSDCKISKDEFSNSEKAKEVNTMFRLSQSNDPASDFILKLIDFFFEESDRLFYIVHEYCVVNLKRIIF